MDLSIVIPAYNEEKRILLTLERTAAFLSQRPWQVELLIVDDGSTDRTMDQVQGFFSPHLLVRYLRNEQNRGKGYAVRRGVAAASGRYIGFMDADYKTDIAGLDAAISLLEQGWDGAIGDRTLSETCILVRRRRFREWGSLVFKGLLHRIIGLKEFGDTQCGFKFFQAKVARDLFARQRIDGFMFDVEILLLAVQAGYRIRRIPVVWSDDPDSRFKPVSGTFRDLGELLGLWWHYRHLL